MAADKHPPTVRDQHLPQQVPIEGYGGYGFRFSGMSHPGSLLCLPSGIHGWPVVDAQSIDVEALRPVFEQAAAISILIVGSGVSIVPLRPEVRARLREASIGVEVMASPPAIRTYNILLAEGRPVAAALLAIN